MNAITEAICILAVTIALTSSINSCSVDTELCGIQTELKHLNENLKKLEQTKQYEKR